MADPSSTPGPKPSSSVKLVLLGEAAVGKSSLVLRFVNNDFQENKEPTIGAAFLTQKCTLPNRTIKFEIWDTAGQERFASLAPMYYRNAQAALVVYDLTKPSSLVKAKHWVAELQRQASPGIVIALVGNKLDLTNDDGGADSPSGAATSEERRLSSDNNNNNNNNNEDNNDAGDGDAETGETGAAVEGGDEGNDQDDEQDETTGDARKISTREASSYADEEGLLFFETSAKTGVNVPEVFTAIANAIPETSLKGPKGPGANAAAGHSGIGAGGARGEDARINLRERGAATAKEGCAC